ncbi:hypothetical protein [Celeribacter halophilus]|nr:hypothetical protein [Celeribacter halophilus]
MSYNYCPKPLHIAQLLATTILISHYNSYIGDGHQHHQRLVRARATA